MNNTETLILSGEGYSLSIAPEAHELKAQLIEAAQTITTVNSPETVEEARAAMKGLAWLRNQVEKSRKAVKEPVIETGKRIDEIARGFIDQAFAEEKRLEKAATDYAFEQEKIRAAAAEAARVQAQELARKQAELEELRRKETFAAEMKAEVAQAEMHDARKSLVADLAVVPTQLDGVKMVLDFEVTDALALATTHPHLVRIEPKRREILSIIEIAAANGTHAAIIAAQPLAGVRVFEKATVSKR